MGLPKRWMPYSKFGQPIPGTRFVALKCPLRPALCAQLPEEKKFTPDLVIELLPSLRMIIDLTFTSKYYTPEVFNDAGLRHVKLLCPGHNVPDKNVVKQFFKEVDSFIEEKEDGLIGVHCTHGVNRTGYLICKYMITKLGFQPEEAIKAFGNARGHHIERPNYLCSLGLSSNLAESMAGEQPVDHVGKPDSNRDRHCQFRGGQSWGEPSREQSDQRSWGQGQQRNYWQDHRPQYHGSSQEVYNNYRRPQPDVARNDGRRYNSSDSRRDYGRPSDRPQGYYPPARGAWGPPRGYHQRPRWEQGRQPQSYTAGSWRKPDQGQESYQSHRKRPSDDREGHKRRRNDD